MDTENTTRNFYLAACYMSLGAKYENMSCDEGNASRKTFHFSGDIDFAQVKKDFSNGTLMINAARYADCLRNLKSILHGSE
jgi:hypothetical protein